MDGLKHEIAEFHTRQQLAGQDARQMAALQIACGIDLDEANLADGEGKARILRRIERAIEKERQRGISGHWSYDLNRHIALKQALDRFRRD